MNGFISSKVDVLPSSVRLVRGDCVNVLRKLGDQNIRAVVTDPPYGVDFEGKSYRGKRITNGYANHDDTAEFVGDVVVPLIVKCIAMFERVVVTPGTRNMFLYPKPSEVGAIYMPAGQGFGRWGFTCFQPILYYGKCPYLAAGKGHRPNSFSTSETARANGHPCPKPIGWMKWLVRKASLAGETVLDPFMGSGTTGVACVMTGRSFVGIEIDPSYFKIAERRIAGAPRRNK